MWWIFILVAAAFIRGPSAWVLQGQLEADPDAYRQLAERWNATGQYALEIRGSSSTSNVPLSERPTQYRTAFRPPLYPLVLAYAFRSGLPYETTVLLLHFLIGLATVGLTFVWAARWGSPKIAAVAAILVALDPLLIVQGSAVMTEPLATLLAVMVLLGWTRATFDGWTLGFWLTGLFLGLAILCRPPFLAWGAVLCLATVLVGIRQGAGRRALLGSVAMGVAAVLIVAPWMVRNQKVFGVPKLTTTHGGYTLLLANNPSFYGAMERGVDLGTWEAESDEFKAILNDAWPNQVRTSAEELERDKAYHDRAVETILSNPALFLRSSGLRIGWFWSPLAHATRGEGSSRAMLRGAAAIFYGIEYVLLGVTLLFSLRCRGPNLRGWAAWAMLALTLTAVHSLYWSNMRMRSPLVPGIAVAAAVGAGLLGSRRMRSLASGELSQED